VLIDLDGEGSTDCHFADSVNARDQIVGGSCGANADGWLWEHGTLADLNTLVAPSAEQLTEAHYINDRGEIAVTGMQPHGDSRVVLLVPKGTAQSEGLTTEAHGNPAAVTDGARSMIHRGPNLRQIVTPSWDRLIQWSYMSDR
jgi:uncharacterized membrane protein